MKSYARLIKLSHTVFALPFALIGFALGVAETMPQDPWILLLQVLVCMVTARSAAMAFNRWADRDIDARNPRTATREIPAGKVSPRGALVFTVVNTVLFIATASTINSLTGVLSPVALVVILGYSYCKRFTALAHLVLGLGLAIAPAGAYIAATGTLTLPVVFLSLTVLTWCAGFDIIYALQDAEFDKKQGLHSIPARFSPHEARTISILLHLATAVFLLCFADFVQGVWTSIGVAFFILCLAYQHLRKAPFDLVNGLASIGLAVCVIIGIFAHYENFL